MPVTLGLDLGPNSVGWALVDEKGKRLIDCGVRVFPEGVDNFETKKEKPRNESRRVARGMRRQIARRARRKRRLRNALISARLYPPDPAAQLALDSLDPYELRARAIQEALTPHEVGRVLLHINQHRGFLSNRKKERKSNEVKGMLAEMSELQQDMDSTNAQTLGVYLHRKARALDHSARSENDHVRHRHIRRDMLEKEFDLIWNEQAKHHTDLLTDQLRYGSTGRQKQPNTPTIAGNDGQILALFGIEGLIFFQRPMYWPRSVVGKCELERKLKRCPRADRRAQRYRMLQEVNNLRYVNPATNEEDPLSDTHRTLLLDKLSRSREMDFDKIRKALGLLESVQFNLEGGKRKKLQGMVTDSFLAAKGAIGPEWHDWKEDRKDAIVELLALSTDDDATHEKLVRDCGLTPQQADAALDVELPAGYMSVSLVAIKKLLPHLEDGLKLMGNDASDSAMHAAGYMRRDELRRRVFDALPDPARARDARIGDIPNPVVKRAIVELRKVVNGIIREYGKPDAVHVELTRQVRQGPKARSEYSTRIRETEAERDQAADEIRKLKDEHPGSGIAVNRDSILRYLLWKQQNCACIYCGNKISQAQLFGGDIDADHILPYSRSLDDSQMNKVVCHRKCNAGKDNQTPYEWLAASKPQRFQEACQHALSLVRKGTFPYKKYRRIIQKELELDDFIARQLTATGYITSATVEYLKCLFEKDHAILGLKGELTAELRRQWGLDDVLSSLPDSPAWHEQNKLRSGEKNRADHRHHAIDAIVVALTDRPRLQELSRVRKGSAAANSSKLGFPWTAFCDEVSKKVSEIKVSHRTERKVAGALHEDTAYGPTKQAGVFAIRKPLETLSPNEIPQIRDAGIRMIVESRLRQHGIETGRGKKDKEDRNAAKKLKLALSNLRMASGVPIRKVRILRNEQTIRPIRRDDPSRSYVKPGSTHHLAFFEWQEKGKRRREAVFVTMLESMDRIKTQQQEFCRLKNEHRDRTGKEITKRDSAHKEYQKRAASTAPLILRRPIAGHESIPKDAKFLFSLSRGETVLANWKGTQRLLVFKTAASTQGQIYFALHTDARKSADQTKYVATANTLDARKVLVDPLGRIRWAND